MSSFAILVHWCQRSVKGLLYLTLSACLPLLQTQDQIVPASEQTVASLFFFLYSSLTRYRKQHRQDGTDVRHLADRWLPGTRWMTDRRVSYRVWWVYYNEACFAFVFVVVKITKQTLKPRRGNTWCECCETGCLCMWLISTSWESLTVHLMQKTSTIQTRI